MTTSDDSIPLKRCSKGAECLHPNGCWQPATPEYFYTHPATRDGLLATCKVCLREYARQRRIENPEGLREYGRRQYAANPQKKHKSTNRWAAANPEKTREYKRRWTAANPEKNRAKTQERRAKKRKLPSEFTAQQWQDCLNWWNGTCAYCGAQQSLFHVLEQEHVISVTDGGGYVAPNIIPACKSCNASKQDRKAEAWLTGKFGKRKAKTILARIQAYFDYIKTIEE